MKKDIHHIHDKTYRSFFENKEIFLQLLQSFVQEAWTTQLQVDKLIEDKSHYILRDFEEAEADIVYHATIEGQEVVFCILLELQSTVDHSMGIRLFYYISEIWRKYLKRFEREEVKRKDFKLPAVVPIVLYNGESGWTATTQFKEKVQRADLFGDYVIDFKYILINVNAYSKEDLIAIQNTVAAVFLLDQKIDTIEFVERAAIVATEFNELTEEHRLKLKDWLDHIIEEPIRQKVLNLLDANKEEVDRMTANITKTLQEEKNQAREMGKLEGKLE
ncbi:MAG: Rpn family recombination-promoting nuclease/putative transposase, partial [Cellulosilyticaceae bacterium]